ncbi:MAG: hypothetical protein R3E53_07605 [Myxococcota bacterium]
MTSVADDLHGYLEAAARATPDAILAVEEAGDAKRSYRELDQLSDRVRDRLVATSSAPAIASASACRSRSTRSRSSTAS